jgi:hypothetical protein
VKAISRTSEPKRNALNTVDLGPKRSFSVGECALWARLTGPRFAAQVAAVVGLVEATATAVANKVLAIKYGNTTGHSITKFLEAPAAEAIAVVDLEEAKRLAAKFEAYGRRRPRHGARSGG